MPLSLNHTQVSICEQTATFTFSFCEEPQELVCRIPKYYPDDVQPGTHSFSMQLRDVAIGSEEFPPIFQGRKPFVDGCCPASVSWNISQRPTDKYLDCELTLIDRCYLRVCNRAQHIVGHIQHAAASQKMFQFFTQGLEETGPDELGAQRQVRKGHLEILVRDTFMDQGFWQAKFLIPPEIKSSINAIGAEGGAGWINTIH